MLVSKEEVGKTAEDSLSTVMVMAVIGSQSGRSAGRLGVHNKGAPKLFPHDYKV